MQYVRKIDEAAKVFDGFEYVTNSEYKLWAYIVQKVSLWAYIRLYTGGLIYRSGFRYHVLKDPQKMGFYLWNARSRAN